MEEYFFTIIMPTYNSEKTIKYSLDSLLEQNYDLSKTECLVIDGGSDDKTLEIAASYGFVKILENPKRLPEYAKQIGFKAAKGRYIIKMDSDEAFIDTNALATREKAFELYPEAHLLTADRLIYTPSDKKGPCGTYINACGDPFTYFIYRQKESVTKSFEKNIVSKDGGICLFDFSKSDIRPIADGGTTTVDADYIKKTFGEKALDDMAFICAVSDRIFDENGKCICIENDNIEHRSNPQLKQYLKKIRFRIINNLFSSSEAGFSSRKASAGAKKYLFPIYTLFVFPALADSVSLSVKYKDAGMLLHVFYCWYTCFELGKYAIMKIFKIKKQNEDY